MYYSYTAYLYKLKTKFVLLFLFLIYIYIYISYSCITHYMFWYIYIMFIYNIFCIYLQNIHLSNMKYYYNLKQLFSILIYNLYKIISSMFSVSRDTSKNHFDMLIWYFEVFDLYKVQKDSIY